MRTRSRFVVLAALLALVAFGGVLTETAFVHTDDGCEIEQHCLACRIAVGAVAALAPVVAPATHLAIAGLVAPQRVVAPASPIVVDAPSRAPPLA